MSAAANEAALKDYKREFEDPSSRPHLLARYARVHRKCDCRGPSTEKRYLACPRLYRKAVSGRSLGLDDSEKAVETLIKRGHSYAGWIRRQRRNRIGEILLRISGYWRQGGRAQNQERPGLASPCIVTKEQPVSTSSQIA